MADLPQLMTQSSATDSSSKRHKLSNEEVKFNKTIDRISSLPDSVLCHILSFLLTKHAVATSILSTRWKYLWTLVPSLDFDDAPVLNRIRCYEGLDSDNYEVMEHLSFVHFVYRVLVLRKASCIKKFRLKCGTNCKSVHFNAWICAAILRDLEELDLCLSFGYAPVKLTRSLFTCKMLMVLKLSQGIVLNVPSAVHFPTLKILHLISVKYQNDDSVRKLFSGCPVLEDLFVERCFYDNVLIFNISAPALKNLKIKFHIYYNSLRAHKLEINAPALEYLDLKDYMSEDISIENLSYVVEANLDFVRVPGDGEYYGNCVFKLLKGLSNVKYLSLSGNTMESLRYASNDDLPIFHNLTQLKMGIRCFNWHVLLLKLLESSHNLQVLTLEKGRRAGAEGWGASRSHGPNGHEACWRRPQHVPKCLLLNLTTIDIRGFKGLKDELKWVRYILKNANALKTMNICCRHLDVEAKFLHLQKLSVCPRASKKCRVAFY